MEINFSQTKRKGNQCKINALCDPWVESKNRANLLELILLMILLVILLMILLVILLVS